MIFDHAMKLSDTLHLKNLRYESMLLKGESWFNRGNHKEGLKFFLEVAGIYHAQGDLQREARTWLRLARKMRWSNASENETISYFERSINLYILAHNNEREVYTRQTFGEYLSLRGKFSMAEQVLLKTLERYQQIGEKKVAYVYYLLSSINRYRAAFDKSLLYATRCVETVHNAADTGFADFYYGELALVYDELDRVAESTVWYRNALEKRIEKNDNRVAIFRTAGFLIRQLVKQNKSREGLALMDSLMARFPPQTTQEKATVAQNMGYCFDGLKQYPQAERYFLEMIRNYRDAGLYDEFVAIANMDIGRFYLKQQQFEKAHTYLASTYQSANPLSDWRELYQMLFVADSALGNYQLAIKDLRKYEMLNDSIFNERKSRQIEELTVQFETNKKEQSIQLLEREGKLQQGKLKQAQTTRRWVLAAAVLMAIFILLLVNYSRLKQRTNKELHIQQKEIEKKNTALQQLVEEKEWLIREIHHRVKNNFQIVQGLLGTQSGYLKSEEAIRALTDSRNRVQAMSMIHQKLYQSENLSAIPIGSYIHELVNHLRNSFNTRPTIQFNFNIDPAELDLSHCIPIGLILNEAITNSLKHAFPGNGAGQIMISLKRTFPSHFVLCVRDNGCGLPAGFDGADSNSMGLRLMRGLSEDIEGRFTIASDNGTVITLEFDYDAELYAGLRRMEIKKSDT
jgi:two-component sensor histidine kinase